MKKLFVLLLIFSASIMNAQVETLLGNGKVDHGGFGGPVVKFTTIKDNFGVLVGGRGGWIIDHTFVIGGGGYGLANEINGSKTILGKPMLINFGYGGFEMEYIANWNKLIHTSAYLLLGAGGVGQREKWTGMDWDHNPDVFFVAEPALNVELNLISFMRLNLGASYRLVIGVDDDGLTDKDFSGFSTIMTFKFGSF